MTTTALPPRTALFLPASNPRAIEKARTLGADLVILDLEDAVKPEDKDGARDAAVAAMADGFGTALSAIRINARDTAEHGEDLIAVRGAACDFIVVPKVESAKDAHAIAMLVEKPILAMIETPLGVLAAAEIAAVSGVAGLIAGTNDLAATLRLPPSAGREALGTALQMIVLAARAHHVWALDGVFNKLDDAEGLAAEARHGRILGFDGKSLIHPNQIAPATAAFAPSAAEISEAQALIAAATGGAERYQGRMIETMHVDQAKAVVLRAKVHGGSNTGGPATGA